MASSTASLRFPHVRVPLPRTRLAYVHVRNLLSDAKRDRAARITGYVAIWLPEELVILYLLSGEVSNATIRDGSGSRPIAIASALEMIPAEPEYGEICFHEADREQLACMYTAHAVTADPWPPGLAVEDPAVLFPYLSALTFDGLVELTAKDAINYLSFRNGAVVRAFLSTADRGSTVERVAKVFGREGRSGQLKLARWSVVPVLPIQAPPALVQAFRELTLSLVQRLVASGSESAPAVAEHARQNLLATHPVLEGFSVNGGVVQNPIADTPRLTAGVAAWIRDVMWAAANIDEQTPEVLLRELTWDRRHMFQSAGLFDQIPWKVM